MGKYIICGRINKYYGYIFLHIIFLVLQDLLFWANYNNIFHDTRLLGLTYKYNIIHSLFCYIVIFFSSFIFYKCRPKKCENLLIKKIEKVEEQNNSKKVFLFITILWVIEEQLKKIYTNTLNNLDFWMLELIIIYLFIKKAFKMILFKHQKLSFIIIIIPFIFKIATIILSFYNKDQNVPIYANNILIFFIGILFYICILISDAYILTKIKWFMDIKYISIPEILMYYGLFGAIFYLIFSIISLFRLCPKILVNDVCIQDNNNETFYNFENFYVYFEELKGNLKLIIEEIIVCLIGSFSFVLENIFALLIIKHLSPIHKIISNPLFFFFQKMFMAINTLCREKKFFVNNSVYILSKFILDITGDIFSIFGLMIYLEIIELNFCGLDYNTRRTISVRAMSDQIEDDNEKKFIFLEDGDIEEISNSKSTIEFQMK